MSRKQFYLLWDIEDLQYAASEACKHGVPLAQTQLWVITR